MKKIALGLFAAVAMTGSAVAADMAPRYTKAPVVAPVAYTWTGCYIGANVGGAWHNIDQYSNRRTDGTVLNPVLGFGSADSGGDFIGGGQIGCDYQFAGNWVVGIQGMFDFGNTNSRNNLPADARLVAIGVPYTTTRTRDLYTVTGRIGYLFTPQLLGYVKGGGAWTNTYTQVYGTLPALFLSESASSDRTGYTVGGGLEYQFARGWSVFGEYNYADFGRKDIAFTAGPGTVGAPNINSTRLTVQAVQVGVNYKFNWASPVVAKY